jgi:hypothetical protein
MVTALVLSITAAGLLAYDAIWAQGARFQRDCAQSRKESIERLIEGEIVSVSALPSQYSAAEKEQMIASFKATWEPRLRDEERMLQYWQDHPSRVQHYALVGLLLLAGASVLQAVVYFIAP